MNAGIRAHSLFVCKLLRGTGTPSYFSEPHKLHTTDQRPSLTQNLRPDLSPNPELRGLWEEARHVAVVSLKHALGNTHSHGGGGGGDHSRLREARVLAK